MLRKLSILGFIFLAASAQASINTANHLALGLGNSVPKGTLEFGYADKTGPNRNNHGEKILINFRAPKHISAIRLTAFSASRAGQVLIRDARARFTNGSKTTETTLVDLFQYNKAAGNGCMDHHKLCLLGDNSSSTAAPNDKFEQIEFTLEGFNRADATILIEMDSADGFLYQDFLLKRSGPSSLDGLLGAFIDEVHYSDMTSREYRTLMRFARQPAITDLATHTYVCSVYSKNNRPRIDFKTRHYFSPTPGTLQSTTDKDATVNTWILTQQGWKLPMTLKTGCGPLNHALVLRMTATGNLISELDLEREDFIRACMAMGYDYYSSERSLNEGTYPSLLSSRNAAGSYEFCRPARVE